MKNTDEQTILLIEDNPGDIRLVKDMLNEITSFNYQLISAETLKEGCEQIRKNHFVLILLDLNLPDSTGKATFDKVVNCAGDIPVVLVSGLIDVDLSLSLIKEGAQDYILKQDLNSNLLGKTIQYALIRKQAELESKVQLCNYASNLQLVREEERVNLAREIHDDLAQLLVALKIDMGLFKKKISKTIDTIKLEEVISEVEQLMCQVDNANKSARGIINGLRPEQLELLGFVEAAEVHLSSFEQSHHIKCSFKNTVLDPNIQPNQALALFRILQESLNNILKHAKATIIKVQLTNIADKLVMEISDNGIGFDVNKKGRPDSYGLIGMNERVKLLGGNLDITSKMGLGTKVKVEIQYGA